MASPVSQSNFPSVMNLLSWGSISYICRRFTLWGRYALHEHLRQDNVLAEMVPNVPKSASYLVLWLCTNSDGIA